MMVEHLIFNGMSYGILAHVCLKSIGKVASGNRLMCYYLRMIIKNKRTNRKLYFVRN